MLCTVRCSHITCRVTSLSLVLHSILCGYVIIHFVLKVISNLLLQTVLLCIFVQMLPNFLDTDLEVNSWQWNCWIKGYVRLQLDRYSPVLVCGNLCLWLGLGHKGGGQTITWKGAAFKNLDSYWREERSRSKSPVPCVRLKKPTLLISCRVFKH